MQAITTTVPLSERFSIRRAKPRLRGHQLELNLPDVEYLASRDPYLARLLLEARLKAHRWMPRWPEHDAALEEVHAGHRFHSNEDLLGFASAVRSRVPFPTKDFHPKFIAHYNEVTIARVPELGQSEMVLDGKAYYRPDRSRHREGYAVAHGIAEVLCAAKVSQATHLDIQLVGIALLCDADAAAYALRTWGIYGAVVRLCRTFRYLPRWAAFVLLDMRRALGRG